MPQTATIKSLPVAFGMLKAMQAEGVEWGEDYRASARRTLAELLEGRMGQLIDEHLERMAELGQADRRNGSYARWLLTELGLIELHVPRTRTFSALRVVRAYARRAQHVDRMILACFVLGLSTRKVAIALLPILGCSLSPATISQVAKQLDAAVAAFHRRPLKDSYRVLVLDGVVLRRKTGAGALARPVLVALGLRPDGKEEVIDFRPATAESAAQWEQFLGNLIRRGLTGERLEMLGVVACLRADLDDLLTCFRYPTIEERKTVRTTNAIERRFREVRRRTRPMGTFQDRTSMERILFAVFMHENRNQGLATPFALTQTF
jgi:transposase-like protein